MPSRRKPKPPTPDPHPVKWGYARVSTVDQDPRMQRDALVAAGVDPRGIFEEQISGAATHKPQLDFLLRDTRPGDTVYVWKLDRLGRTAIDLYRTAQAIQDKGARLVILTMPGMDTATPMGRAMFGMLAVFAEFERSIGIERTKAALAAARARGRIGGRRSAVTDEQVLETESWPVPRAMKALKFKSRMGYLRRLNQAKEAKARERQECN